MIKFDKLFEVAKEHGISIYTMYQYLGISRSQIYRIKDGKVQISTLNNVLQILYEQTGIIFDMSDICEFVPDSKNEDNEEHEKKED